MNDQRNSYGFPVIDANEQKRIEARPIAAAARIRNEPPCQCAACKQIENLPKVQRITGWKLI